MTPKGSRSATLLALLLLLLPSLLAGTGQAHHTTRADADRDSEFYDRLPVVPLPQNVRDTLGALPTVVPDPNDVPLPKEEDIYGRVPATTPTVDQVRDEIIQHRRDAEQAIRQELIRRNATPDSILPNAILGARVLEDHVEPGSRIGGIGDWRAGGGSKGWRVAHGIGSNDTSAFTMTDPATGYYVTTDTLLVTPAIDLSAYLLETGNYPIISGDPHKTVNRNPCNIRWNGLNLYNVFASLMLPCTIEQYSVPYLSDQIVLLFRHRYNFLAGEDGGQVLVFTKDPAAGGKGALLYPVPAYGDYDGRVRALGDSQGYSGSSGWNVSAFDLTQYAGKTIWLGFRAAAGPRASSDPGYFNARAFPDGPPFGWVVDDVHVYADAYGRNLKVYSLETPSFRTSPGDPYDRFPPGHAFNATTTVLNAGAGRTTATVQLRMGDDVLATYVRELEAGEAWNVSTPIRAPGAEGAEFTLTANVSSPGPADTRLDPDIKSDDQMSRTFLVSSFTQYAVTFDTAVSIVDDGAAQTATARVANTGNVPIRIDLTMWEQYNATNVTTGAREIPVHITHAPASVTLEVGETSAVSWPVTTGSRGPHVLQLNATGAGVRNVLNHTYYVHASPPPSYAVGIEDNSTAGWEAVLSAVPIDPLNGWAWMAYHPTGPVAFDRIFAAGVNDTGGETEFKDLRLKIRYFANTRANFSLVYPSPLATALVASDDEVGVKEVWNHTTPEIPRGSLSEMTNLTWTTLEMDVIPREAQGYHTALWSLKGLEFRIRLHKNPESFILDELAVTGVPADGDEGSRRELIRVTGREDDPTPVRQLDPTGTRAPALASCDSLPVVGNEMNCWQRVDNAKLRDLALRKQGDGSRWRITNETVEGGRVAFFRYNSRDNRSESDRMVSPVINLTGATDPLVFLDHSYAFRGWPMDRLEPLAYIYDLRQFGFLEAQYLRDDGTWSDFVRLVPQGGYRKLFETTDDGENPRNPMAWPDGSGFFQPTKCKPNTGTYKGYCDNAGFVNNLVRGRLVWRQYPPTPYQEVSVFRLKEGFPDVNLTERPIRLGVHASRMSGTNLEHIEHSQWDVMGIRVTPVSRFAIDAAVANVALETTYDWKRLGVAPGSVVPVNVTVRNDGLFGESWSVRLGVAAPGSTPTFGGNHTLGNVVPGDTASIVLPWNVSELEGKAWALTIEVFPTDNRTEDENRFNDRLVVGADNSLLARTVQDVAVDLQAFPAQGDVDTIRYLPVTLRNMGNVPLEGLTVDRAINVFTGTGTEPADTRSFELTKPVMPDGKPVLLPLLAGGVRDADMSFIPSIYGNYLVIVQVKKSGTALAGDATPGDNVARAYIEATEPLFAEDFDTRTDWYTTHPDVWGEGAGFRSAGAMQAANRTTGLLPPSTDASVVTTRLPISNARTAVVNLMTRYDLETGYDGGVIEVSRDNRTWHRVGILDAYGRTGPYPTVITSSSPLAEGYPVDEPITAFSGDSASLPNSIDGWAPVSIDLASVPQLSEAVVFKSLNAPAPIVEPLLNDSTNDRILYRESWVQDASDPAGRWEVRNEGYRLDGIARFWSGPVEPNTASKQLFRSFSLTDSPANSALVVTWWDRRPGTLNSDWRGVGAEYVLKATVAGDTRNYADPNNVEVVGQSGSWYRLRVVLDPTLPRDKVVTLSFDMLRTLAAGAISSAPNTGWEVRDIRVEAMPANLGIPIPGSSPLKILAGDQPNEHMLWSPSSGKAWFWLAGDRPVPTAKPAAPWKVDVQDGPDGRRRPQWNLTLDAANRTIDELTKFNLGWNVDTRLVSPVIDLADVGGGKTVLRMTHRWNLAWNETFQSSGNHRSDRRYYQGGTVEIEMYNRTTQTWDPPRQLFADALGPDRDVRQRTNPYAYATDAAPYTKTLADAGDTFERFPRRHMQEIRATPASTDWKNAYFRPFDVPTAYAFSGDSTLIPGNQSGWFTHEFDLAAYRGERVRIVFHAWSGPNDPPEYPPGERYWAIASAEVIGNVLSTEDVWMRFRLGTDASGLTGSWAVDQFAINGRRYLRSVGIHLDQPPEAVGREGFVNITGRLQNYGRGARDVGLGILVTTLDGDTPPIVTPIDTPSLVLPPGFTNAAGPFALGPAGSANASQPFRLMVQGKAMGNYTFRLVVLDAVAAGAGISFGTAQDDVPGRALRQWDLTVEDRAAAEIDAVTTSPAAFDAPILATATVTGRNVGTLDLKLSAEFAWTNVSNGTRVHETRVPAPGEEPVLVRPGMPFSITMPAWRPAGTGNFTLGVKLFHDGKPFDPAVSASRLVRVAQREVLHAASFDDSDDGWMGQRIGSNTAGEFSYVKDEVLFGNRSVLFGLTNAEYAEGRRLQDGATGGGCSTLTNTMPCGLFRSPPIDLRAAGATPVLTYWQKSVLDPRYTKVYIEAQRIDSGGIFDRDCHADAGDWTRLQPEPQQSLTGRQSDWTQVRVPLGTTSSGCPFSGGYAQLRFRIVDALDQGWRLDGVTVHGGETLIEPAGRTHELGDGVKKTYFFDVENGGLTRKDLNFTLERNLSRVSPEQVQWVSISPARVLLDPGAKTRVTVVVDAPSSRSLFAQPINLTIGVREQGKPYVLDLIRLDLDFQPKLRADLAAVASIDGKPLGFDRVGIEEGTPHEIGVLVSNLGTEASRPTDVVLRIVNATGGVEWTHRERVEGLRPVGEGGEAVLVASTWKPTFGKRGNYTLQVSIDPDRLQVDLDRANGELALPLAVTPLIRPDLVVDARSLRISTPDGARLHEAQPGQLVRISGLVRNDGLADARQVTIRIIAGSSVLKEEVIPLLKAGDGYVASTNQIAPPTTTVYQIVALTPDVEIHPDNNAQLLELPILPPELVIGALDAAVALQPGDRRAVSLDVTNTAPYPTTVNLSVGAGVRFASLSTTRFALGPGETRNVTLVLEPAARELAGEGVATVLAETSEGVRTRRTVDVEVAAVPSASAVTYLARGPPQALRIELDAVNTGNVELRPHAVVRDASGKVLLRKELPALPPGKARFDALSLRLPDATPPGPLALQVEVEAEGTRLAATAVQAEVEAWGRLVARATPGEPRDGVRDVAVSVSYDGNAPTVRQPVVFNAPAGVVARYSEDSLSLAPGETRNLTLRIATPRQAPAGLWLLQAGFLDPASGATSLLGNLTSIPLDLRAAKVELASARRVSAEVPAGGGPVEYVAKLRNVGDRASGSVPVDLYVDGALVDRQLVEALAPGETREIRLVYAAEAGRHAIVLAVDPHGAHADDARAFAETLDVARGPVDGIPGLQEVPTLSPLVLVLALVLVAACIRRRGPFR